MVGIYRNSLDSITQRSQMIKVAGRTCSRGGTEDALRLAVGKRTESCSLRTPVLGTDMEIAATMRLLSGTPTALQKKAFLGVELRAGGGAKYQLLVYPLQRKAQLVKVTADGPEYFQIAKNLPAVMGVNKANALRLRALKIRAEGPDRGKVALTGFLGQERIVEGIDALPGEVAGEASTVIAGAPKNGDGVIASIDDVVVRVPSPF
ncbi:MAG: hypothetical protein JJE35_02990 [Thermoleophilia bacterium]|nr:hypothetical protein [Thermoleophilia bacterium]